MRYLTHDWWWQHGVFDDQDEYQANRRVAEAEFDAIKADLPEGLRDFMRFYRSRLTKLEVDSENRTLEFTLLGSLRGEVNEFHPVRYEITLSGLSHFAIVPNSKDSVMEAWHGAMGDYGFGEFEIIGNNKIRWGMLFSNRVELSATFKDAEVKIIPRSSRKEGMPELVEDVRRVRRRRGRRAFRSQL